MKEMQDAVQFSERLATLHLAFRSIHDILQQERACLSQNRTLDLPSICEQKNAQLEILEKAITPLLFLTKHSNPDEAFQTHIQNLSPSDQQRLTTMWKEIKALSSETQMQNEINGAVIAINLYNTRRLIHLLRTGDSIAQTYDQKGKETHSQVNTNFVEA